MNDEETEDAIAPTNILEWEAYIMTLPEDVVLSKAKAANQVAFVRSLLEDGLTPSDVTHVFKTFANRLQQLQIEPPGQTSGCYLSYKNL